MTRPKRQTSRHDRIGVGGVPRQVSAHLRKDATPKNTTKGKEGKWKNQGADIGKGGALPKRRRYVSQKKTAGASPSVQKTKTRNDRPRAYGNPASLARHDQKDSRDY